MSATPVNQNKNLVTEPPVSPLIHQSKQPLLMPIFASLFVITLLLAAFLFNQNQQLKNQLSQLAIVIPSPETIIEQDLAANWKNYSHKINQISFSYPADWTIDVTNENESYDATVTLTKKNYIIRIISRADGLGGGISTAPTKPIVINGQTYYKQYYTFTHDKVIRTDNQPDGIGAIRANGLNYIIDITYPDSEVNSTQESQILAEFDQILSSIKFLDNTSTEPTSPSAQKLTYQLPSGWQTTQDNQQYLEIGYDPNLYTPFTEQVYHSVFFNYVGHPGSLRFSVVPYGGGSRHTFIYKQLGYTAETAADERLPNYYEKEYSYNGWSCLILYGLGYSASGTTWGMCAIAKDTALFIEGPSNQAETEKIVQTIKIVK